MDEAPRDKRKTDPMRFSHSDRVHVENRIDALTTEIRTRLPPLEDEARKLRGIVWFSVGLATASLAVQLFRILVLALTGKLN